MDVDSNFNRISTPTPDLNIDTALVQRLLKEQYPDLAHLPIQSVDAGWDNAIFRLGDRLAVRLPRRTSAAVLIEHEQRWLPQLSRQCAIATPYPYRLGKPTDDYPWRWSIQPWLIGTTADLAKPGSDQADRWAAFMNSLHVPAPLDAPHNSFRGVPLSQRAAAIDERMDRLGNLIAPGIKRMWQRAVGTDIDVQSTWIHGDLHPRNILVKDGVIAGVIDWGDLTSGDAATDLASVWMLFADQQARQQVLDGYAHLSDQLRQRALGWAILFGVVLLETGLTDHPRHAAIGKKILHHIAEDL